MFYNFVYYDLKQLLQLVNKPEHLVGFTKLLVFFQADEDPELYELISEAVCKHVQRIPVDDLLAVLANLSQSLSPATQEVFKVVNEEFCTRLTHDHNPVTVALVL